MAETHKVILPKLHDDFEEGEIEQWFFKVGDKVNEGDILFELETDKVSIEVPSDFTGYLSAILVKENEKVTQGSVVCEIDTSIKLDLVPISEEKFKEITNQIQESKNLAWLKKEVIKTLELPDDSSNEEIIQKLKKSLMQ